MSELNSQLADFAGDRLNREANLAICHRFAAQPLHWLATVVLVEELLQAMFTLSNQPLAQAKLGWWADEADLTVSGAPRHPLTQWLSAAKSDLRALPPLMRTVQEWIISPTAADLDAQRQQFSAFAAAASELVNEGDCAAIWTQLALKRQLQSCLKPERYGPCALSRAALAEFQLKASQISAIAASPNEKFGPEKIGPALSAQLTAIHQTLRAALPAQALGIQSATRAYGLLHAREAAQWAKSALVAPSAGFLPSAPGLIGLLQAWWIARA